MLGSFLLISVRSPINGFSNAFIKLRRKRFVLSVTLLEVVSPRGFIKEFEKS